MITEIGSSIPPALRIQEITKPTDTHRIFRSTEIETPPPSYLMALPKKLYDWWQITPDRDVNRETFFITSRKQKFEEVQKLMEGLTLRQAPIKLATLDQTVDLVLLAVFRVFKGYKQLQAPCFIEEAALNLDGFKGPFPGVHYRTIVEGGIGKRIFAETYDGKQASMLSAFAYTEDGITAHVFTGNCRGTVSNPKEKWVEVDGWDPFIKLSGYRQHLSELRSFKHIVNMRLLPCSEMRSVMRNKNYPGVYECHITIYNSASKINSLKPEPEYVQKFEESCEKIFVKALYIEMDNKNKPVQLQTAAYHTYKNYSEAIKAVHTDAAKLMQLGHQILRVRLEAMLNNEDCPKTDEEARKVDISNYYEFHARMDAIDPEKFLGYEVILNSFNSESFGEHREGRNIVKHSFVGKARRVFTNMRSYKVGSGTALATWRRLLSALTEAEFKVVKEVKPEYCVYDGEPNLDSLKIDTPA